MGDRGAVSSDELRVDTIRYGRSDEGRFERMGISPNRGLECYVSEAALRAGRCGPDDVRASVARVSAEAMEVGGVRVWGWERQPSHPDVFYPPDWDDTCKALDFLHLARRRFGLECLTAIPASLPDDAFWVEAISGALFEITNGADPPDGKDGSRLRLSVFFGPGAPSLLLRDDPMVTAVTLRTIATWYPGVWAALEDELLRLCRHVCDVLRRCLISEVSFASMSRYYFSLGHFALRVIEAIEMAGLEPSLCHFPDPEARERSGLAIARLSEFPRIAPAPEEFWWVLSGHRLGMEVPDDARRRVGDVPARMFDFVFRHRRLSHYYGAWNWTRRMLFSEFGAIGLAECGWRYPSGHEQPASRERAGWGGGDMYAST